MTEHDDGWLEGLLDGAILFGSPGAVLAVLIILGVAWAFGAFN